MGGHKVHRRAALPAEGQEFGNPGVVGGGRAAHPQRAVHRLHRPGRHLVQLEILLPGPGPEAVGKARPAQVWLVPHLEVPLADLLRPVPRPDVADKLPDEPGPLAVVPGGRGIAFVVEQGAVPAGKSLRHEAQLHKGPHADGQQEVKYLVDAGEGQGDAAGEHAFQNHVHVVAEQAVEAHIAEAQLPAAPLKLALPVGAQGGGGVAGAHAEVPIARQRSAGRVEIQRKLLHDYPRFRASSKGRPVLLPMIAKGAKQKYPRFFEDNRWYFILRKSVV